MTTLEERQKTWHHKLVGWNHGSIPGRNDLPAALYEMWVSGDFGDDSGLLAVALEQAWTLPEFPTDLVDLDAWAELFGECGFIDNDQVAKIPEPVPTLYRSAAKEFRHGMSWTDNYEKAIWFDNRNLRWGFETVMLKLTPDRFDVLAHFHGEGTRNEDEWVVHPAATYNAEQIEVSE